MFGEFDSESPRAPSPWDSLTPPPSSPPIHNAIPKLVPEADEGNVEYKLQLLSPTPARFARLVTQLKWRLLEGGGQAYYEIGVADAGALVGLPRHQLEESLETLEMMAGEIGASVIVVKEIEVPPELSSLAQSQIERWDGKRSSRRKDLLRMMKQDGSPTTSATELETELSNTDATGTEETSSPSPVTSPASPVGESSFIQPNQPLNPLPFDSALAVFTVDAPEDVADDADDEAPDNDAAECVAQLSVNLEISSVYKPRPMKKRAMYMTSPQPTGHEYAKGRSKDGYPAFKPTDARHTGDLVASDSEETHLESKGSNAQFTGDKQDKQRELKLCTQPSHIPPRSSSKLPANPVDPHTTPLGTGDDFSEFAPEAPQTAVTDPSADIISGTAVLSKEPRLIVEALVIRKLSFDEVFLDFEGFSVQ